MMQSLIEYSTYMEQNNFNKETIKALKEAERIAKGLMLNIILMWKKL